MQRVRIYTQEDYTPEKGRVKNKGCRRRGLKRRFGITLQDYSRIFKLQNGCCGVCGRPQSEFKNKFAVDHNHRTQEIRGLLCVRCNVFLGNLESNYKKKAEKYLNGKNIKNIRRIVKEGTLFG